MRENSYLLGTLLVSKFQQLAMARQSQKAESRRDFWLYIDEFDHFITPSMAKILSAVRKYRLGFTLAHQELHQLQSDPKVASAVLTQPCTRIVFKVGDDDAKKLGEGFESFDAKSLKNLRKFQAIARVERNDGDFNLSLRKPESPDESEAQEQRDKCIAASRAKYATARLAVEAELLTRVWGERPTPPPDDSGGTVAPKIPPPPPPPPPVFTKLPEVPTKPVPEIKPAPMVEVPAPKGEPAPPPQEKILPVVVVEPPKSPEPKPEPILEITPAPAPAPVTDSQKEPAASVPATLAEAPVVAKPATEESPKPAVVEESKPRMAGRGFQWHKNVQKRLKEEGQKLGFNSAIEKQLIKGEMKAADVVFRRGHIEIAVEIGSSGSTVNHEFENVAKCLQAGFSRVAAISMNKKFRESLKGAVEGALGPVEAAKVGYYTPDEFLDELRKLAAASEEPPPKEPMAKREKRRGFIIERNFPKLTPDEQAATQQSIFEVVTKALTGPS